jgi:hypothetical protein
MRVEGLFTKFTSRDRDVFAIEEMNPIAIQTFLTFLPWTSGTLRDVREREGKSTTKVDLHFGTRENGVEVLRDRHESGHSS